MFTRVVLSILCSERGQPPSKGQAKRTLVYIIYRKSPLKEDNLSTKDITAGPKGVLINKKFHCTYHKKLNSPQLSVASLAVNYHQHHWVGLIDYCNHVTSHVLPDCLMHRHNNNYATYYCSVATN